MANKWLVLALILFWPSLFSQSKKSEISDGAFSKELLLLYILTKVWVLHTTNAGPNMLFHVFCAKKLNKERKSKKIGWQYKASKKASSKISDI